MNAVPKPLTVENLKASLGRAEVLHGVDLTIKAGELVVVVGPNGAGKTTLLKAVAGLLPASGTVTIDGIPLSKMPTVERARRVSYLPQGHIFHWPLAVEDIVALGRLPRNAGAGLAAADHAAIRRAMDATGIADYSKRPVTTLSGGERARVALARVLATESRLILADEPTASLDPHYQLVVLDILRRHVKAGGAAVAVLHDLGLAARRADRIVILDKGWIVADGAPRVVLTKQRLADTFGVNAQIVTLVDAPVVIPWTVI